MLIQIANGKLATNKVQKLLIGLSLSRSINYIIYSVTLLFAFRLQILVKFFFPSLPYTQLT